VPLSTRAWADLGINTASGRFDCRQWAVDELRCPSINQEEIPKLCKRHRCTK
jgi:hypothetical protein